jgi:hypothetical protein
MRGLLRILLILFSPILVVITGFGIALLTDVAGNFWGFAATACIAVATLSLALLTDFLDLERSRKEH